MEDALRKSKISEASIRNLLHHFKCINDIIGSNKSVHQLADELQMDKIDTLRLSKLLQKEEPIQSIKTNVIVISTKEHQAVHVLYKEFENVSNVMKNIQIAIDDINTCYDTVCQSIHKYFDDILRNHLEHKQNELLSTIDTLYQHKYTVLQNQLIYTEKHAQDIENAQTICRKIQGHKHRQCAIRKYYRTLCTHSNVPLCSITAPSLLFAINMDKILHNALQINDCEPPNIVSVSALNKEVHSMNICWKVSAKIYDKLNICKPKHKNPKSKDTKDAKKKCKIIFQVSWKEIANEKEERVDIKEDSLWSYSHDIYDSFSFLLRFLNGNSGYMIRIRGKYRKSEQWSLWCENYTFCTKQLELRWSPQKCNNDPAPKFDRKRTNKIKIRESGISKAGIEYVINAKKYELFVVSFKIERFHKSIHKKGAVYLGFMPSNLNPIALQRNGYNLIHEIQHKLQTMPNGQKLHKRNIYYKVPLGNMTSFDTVKKDPFAYCIEIKEDKSSIKIYSPQKETKKIDLNSKVSTDDLWIFEFRMKKKYCLVYRNDELVINKKYFEQTPNAICPIISNSRHKNACTVYVYTGKCKRIRI